MAGKAPFLKGSAMILGIPFGGTSLNILPSDNATTSETSCTEDIKQVDEMMKHRGDLDKQTTSDQTTWQKWNNIIQKDSSWNKFPTLGESWKWNDEDIDQNTMDQMMKQCEDLNEQTTSDQKTCQNWTNVLQKPSCWNKSKTLGESWKWNDEDIDQNTMDQMMKQREDLNKQTMSDQKTCEKWTNVFQKPSCWNKSKTLAESWKWNDEDIDQNTMDQMIKQRDDLNKSVNNQIKHQNIDDEAAWKEIMKWESMHINKEDGSMTDCKMHSSECRADFYSPKARLGALMGFKLPFDRHDCIVNRDGKEIRYVVEYYHDKKDVSEDASNSDAQIPVKIDVRPALNSFDAFQDRMKFAWSEWSKKPDIQAPTKSQN